MVAWKTCLCNCHLKLSSLAARQTLGGEERNTGTTLKLPSLMSLPQKFLPLDGSVADSASCSSLFTPQAWREEILLSDQARHTVLFTFPFTDEGQQPRGGRGPQQLSSQLPRSEGKPVVWGGPVCLSAVRCESVLVLRGRQRKRNWPTQACISIHPHPLVFLLLYVKRFGLVPTNKEDSEMTIEPCILILTDFSRSSVTRQFLRKRPPSSQQQLVKEEIGEKSIQVFLI